jgi:putative protease
MTELLAPAGDLECFKQAIYNGADAVYLATERFGARAYAKNLTLDELKIALSLAHQIGKKIYVTVNTELKENELEDCKKYVKTLYELGVDAVIVADYSMINFIIEQCPNMEAHISTQVGIKDLNDVYFFDSIGAKRCVLAREVSFDEIKKIKEVSKMPLEIFAHGALCVSYSGGCLFSSMLTLRSGNRGRCAQNCRRDYKLYKDGKLIEEGYHLSMRDLNTSYYLKDLQNIDVNSLKIEGRMKDPEYVKIVVSEYRKKMDDPNYEPKSLDTIFHRNYTKGFLFNEDRGSIVDIHKKNNEGAFIGTIGDKQGNLTRVNLTRDLQLNDRIRIEGEEDYFFTVDQIFDLKNNEVTKTNKPCLLNIYRQMEPGAKIYKMIDTSIDLTITNLFKAPITIVASGSVGTPLTLQTSVQGIKFEGKSEALFEPSQSRPIDLQTLTKQLKKLSDTSLYLDKVINNLNGDLFMTISSINEARRNLVDNITSYFQGRRNNFINKSEFNAPSYNDHELMLTAYCTTREQYIECQKAGIKKIYFEDENTYTAYVKPHYNKTENYMLVGSYGGIQFHKGQASEIISDYSFNVCNSDSIYYLHKHGVDVVTLSLEMSQNEIKNVVDSYRQKFNQNPNIEITVYGHQNLMTLKYCPLRRYGECGKCQDHTYELEDSYSKFPTSRKDCITHIYNDKALNLIDDLNEIRQLTNRIRLQFTIEDQAETRKVIEEYMEKINNPYNSKSYFNKKMDTRGYYKREVL